MSDTDMNACFHTELITAELHFQCKKEDYLTEKVD